MLKVETKKNFDEIIQDNKRVAVIFTAIWCGPCQFIGPIFEALARDFMSIKFIKVDIDENSETAEAQGISAVPTFKFFKDGRTFKEGVAGADENILKKNLNELANS